MTWRNYSDTHAHHTVVGTLLQYTALWSPQLNNHRDILVWLPPDYYASTRRYPVFYMHDGQNLFDQYTSFVGEWRVDETMHLLSAQGFPAIIVGIPNMGAQRVLEYSPFSDARFGKGQGDQYLAFVADTIKPLIDAQFRTLPNREQTAILGSSMGGLISLYGFFKRGDVFGAVGCMSPSLWFARRAIFAYISGTVFQSGVVYLDIGGQEGPVNTLVHDQPNMMLRATRDMEQLLRRKGYHPQADLLYIEAPDAGHNEAAWAERMPDALRFLISRITRSPSQQIGWRGVIN
jgi:predicted alpha/beta superfamily hydrolase